MRRLTAALLPLALLAACGTPQEQCIRRATGELRTVERLIAESEATLARGYGFETEERVRWNWVVCDRFTDGTGQYHARMCWEPVRDTVRRPVAIDPAAEQRKLEGLRAKRAALQRAAEPQIAACRATYPE